VKQTISTIDRFRKDPVGFVRRAFYKLFVGSFVYRKGGGYDAHRYWTDRFQKYGSDLRGAGDEGLSEGENRGMYERAGQTFLEVCRRESVDFPRVRVLEIGCGTGFYTGILRAQGVRSYTAVDITDALFDRHREDFPGYTFIRQDVTDSQLDGDFDLICMIDVIQHIVGDERFRGAMENVKRCLKPGGLFLLTPIHGDSGKKMFYFHTRTLAEIAAHFPDYRFSDPVPFRSTALVAIRKPGLAQ